MHYNKQQSGENSPHCCYVSVKYQYTFKKTGTIIPIMIGDVALSDAFKYYLLRRQFYRLSENPTDQEINDMIDQISHAIITKK